MKTLLLKIAVLSVMVLGIALPSVAEAQSRSQLQRRQQQKNQWRNVAYGSAALGALGLINKNSTLTLLGAAGTAYSAHRYEQDRRSQRRLQDSRNRALRFSSNRTRSRAQRLSSQRSTNRSRWISNGPGRRGIGHAYGHYKNRGR